MIGRALRALGRLWDATFSLHLSSQASLRKAYSEVEFSKIISLQVDMIKKGAVADSARQRPWIKLYEK